MTSQRRRLLLFDKRRIDFPELGFKIRGIQIGFRHDPVRVEQPHGWQRVDSVIRSDGRIPATLSPTGEEDLLPVQVMVFHERLD